MESVLEVLQKKTQPKTQRSFFVNIDKPPVDDNEKSENIAEETVHKIQIVDKTESSNIDMDIIMERIGKMLIVSNKFKTTESEKIEDELEKIEDIPENVVTDSDDTVKEKQNEDSKEEEKESIHDAVDKNEIEENIDNVIEPVTKKEKKKTISNMSVEHLKIGDNKISERMEYKKGTIKHRVSPYYMNNRKISIQKLNQLFQKFKDESNDESEDFGLMKNQKVVVEYLNLYTPYRGLLLLHGLGAGKTCGSIAVVEAMKSDKKVVIMTPASLEMNYITELKKCGDNLFRENQYWEFISTVGEPDYENILSSALSLPKEYINKNNGAWLVNVKKQPNFNELSSSEQTMINEQLDEMIRSKFTFIHYNGLNRWEQVNRLTNDGKENPFDNAVIVIDEAHNFVSRIVNKIKSKKSINYTLYELLLNATNARIVLLTGTPIINYPNEIGILYNILRGHIKTWIFNIKTTGKLDIDIIKNMFKRNNLNTYDYIEYNRNKIIITRNPYGFVNTFNKSGDYAGVQLDETGNLSDSDFQTIVTNIFKKNNIEITKIDVELHKALPDDADKFINMFVDSDKINIKNNILFNRRILGLTSYFESADESLLPQFIKTEEGSHIHIVNCEMSDYQFTDYYKIRKEEADKEESSKRNTKVKNTDGNEMYNISSSYRVYSRVCCNFSFPNPPGRPKPIKKNETEELTEDDLDAMNAITENPEKEETNDKIEYKKQIQQAIQYLKDNASDCLTKKGLEQYSPKFLEILNNIKNKDHKGLHLIYSQFRSLEGIEILKLILETNGYAELKIKKINGVWELDIDEDDDTWASKPKFMLYTGTENSPKDEKKEILRNIYNSTWDYVKMSNIAKKLREISENNYFGEIVKVMMITQSGSEGIDLKNTRYVHIVEPYWNMVRIHQVIGRARRIKSHINLPEEFRTVQAFLYLTTFGEGQVTQDKHREFFVRKSNLSRDKKTPITTDEKLYELSRVKDEINQQIMKSVKETSIDCSLHSESDELVCFGPKYFGNVTSDNFSTIPNIKSDELMKEDESKIVKGKDFAEVTYNDKKYIYNKKSLVVYDWDSYQRSKTTQEPPKRIGEFNKKKTEILFDV